MTWKTRIMALVLAASAGALIAQAPASSPSQPVTITGSVVRYTPGQTIVIKSSDGRTTTYSIGSVTDVPAEIPVGKSVTISTGPASDGSGTAVVTRIQTTTVNAQGQVKTTTERTEQSPAGTTTASSTAVYGTVTAYEPGQSITIERPGHAVVTYTIDTSSQLPEDLALGKTVTMTTTTTTSSERPVVRTMTYKTVTKTTKTTKNKQ